MDKTPVLMRRLSADDPADRDLIIAYARASEPNHRDAEELAVLTADQIRAGDIVLEVHDGFLLPVFDTGPGVPVLIDQP